MAQFAGLVVVLALAFAAASGLEPALEAFDALPADDACSGEECTASFRQLRGLSLHAEARGHGEANTSGAEDADSEPGVCCFSSEDKNDVCGTCYTQSIATDSQCSRKSQCGACGGNWCRSGCVMGAADPKRKCSTAYDTGIAKAGTYCAGGKDGCASCNGEWCQVIAFKKSGADKDKEEGDEDEGKDEDAPMRNEDHGFCCYHGDEDNVCSAGVCTDVATDATCSTEKNCAGCGGTWCAGPKCVVAFADKKNPCGSAYEGRVAASDNYCSHSEAACSNCAGAWCHEADIKFIKQETGDEGKADGDSSDEDEDDVPEGPADALPEDADRTPASANDTDGSATRPSEPPAEEDGDGSTAEEDGDASPEEEEPEDSSEDDADAGYDDSFDDLSA